MVTDLISVIIPVYNVQNYIEQCIQSVINQTYKKLEILIVDDGSPDNSFLIYEQYAALDNRIHIIKKKNGGLASARNAALNVAKGEYIVCIDSDDWIEKNMIEILYKNIKSYNADLSVCDFYQDRGDTSSYSKDDNKIAILNRNEAMIYAILPAKYYGFAWNKMYKRVLIGELRYNEKFLKGEDSPFTCEYINGCNKVIYQNIPLYHYRVDSVSISRSSFNIGKMSVLESYCSIIDLLKNNGYDKNIVELQKVEYANQLLSLMINIAYSGPRNFDAQKKYIWKEMQRYKNLYLKSRNINLLHKFIYCILQCDYNICGLLCFIIHKVKGGKYDT